MRYRVEFHCHTIYSKDSLVEPRDLVKTARARGLDRLVITDHNTIRGALAAEKLDPELVIVGEEIMTTQGELLAAFVKEEIPSGLPPLEVIHRLREQQAFISVSHPFDKNRNGAWKEDDLLMIVPLVDAIETFNARCALNAYNEQAKNFARKYQLAGTVGSDAHTLPEIGRATQIIEEFTNADELASNLRQAENVEKLSSYFVHFESRWAVLLKKLKLVIIP